MGEIEKVDNILSVIEDDLIWYSMESDKNGISCYVPVANHNSEKGDYNVHIYLQQENEECWFVKRMVWMGESLDVDSMITCDVNIETKEVSTEGFTLSINSDVIIENTWVAIYSSDNEESDGSGLNLKLYALDIKDGSASGYVSASDYDYPSEYTVRVYIKNQDGSGVYRALTIQADTGDIAQWE